MTKYNHRPVHILLVDDNPGDIRLTMMALRESKIDNQLFVATNGVEALAMLRKEGEYFGNSPILVFIG